MKQYRLKKEIKYLVREYRKSGWSVVRYNKMYLTKTEKEIIDAYRKAKEMGWVVRRIHVTNGGIIIQEENGRAFQLEKSTPKIVIIGATITGGTITQ